MLYEQVSQEEAQRMADTVAVRGSIANQMTMTVFGVRVVDVSPAELDPSYAEMKPGDKLGFISEVNVRYAEKLLFKLLNEYTDPAKVGAKLDPPLRPDEISGLVDALARPGTFLNQMVRSVSGARVAQVTLPDVCPDFAQMSLDEKIDYLAQVNMAYAESLLFTTMMEYARKMGGIEKSVADAKKRGTFPSDAQIDKFIKPWADAIVDGLESKAKPAEVVARMVAGFKDLPLAQGEALFQKVVLDMKSVWAMQRSQKAGKQPNDADRPKNIDEIITTLKMDDLFPAPDSEAPTAPARPAGRGPR